MKIISGGQTGTDRAALDAARLLGLELGGWCPRGGRSEDGADLLSLYPELRETRSRRYSERTEKNIAEARATIILQRGSPHKGEALALRRAQQSGKPWIIVDLEKEGAAEKIREFIYKHQAETLNISGPRESSSPGVYKKTLSLLLEAFAYEPSA